MKVAVTGGSGVVGTALIRLLVRRGHHVTGLGRSSTSLSKIEGLGASPVGGDVLEPASLGELVDGCQWVFHVAGVNEFCSADPDRMDRVNLEGTRNVLQASTDSGVERLIHTSSAVTLGEPTGEVGTEATMHRGSYRSRYERSKVLSERLVMESSDLDVVVVNPSSVQGPGRATGTARIFLDVLNGRLPFLVDAQISLVDIDDCAAGHLLAAEKGLAGERYVLSGSTLTVRQALEVLAGMTEIQSTPRFIPSWVASAGAGVVEAGSRIVGKHPLVCREMIRVLTAGTIYDGSRATRELGLVYNSIEETISRTVEWFAAEGLLS